MSRPKKPVPETQATLQEEVPVKDPLADEMMVTESISEADKVVFELAKMQRKIALANAEKALAQNESSEAGYRYLVLQLYVKYKMNTEKDKLNEDGSIIRG